MLSALDAKIITIESRLSERDMDDLKSISARVAAAAVNGKYYDEWTEDWRTARWYSDDVLWALEKLGYEFEQRDCESHYSYKISW